VKIYVEQITCIPCIKQGNYNRRIQLREDEDGKTFGYCEFPSCKNYLKKFYLNRTISVKENGKAIICKNCKFWKESNCFMICTNEKSDTISSIAGYSCEYGEAKPNESKS